MFLSFIFPMIHKKNHIPLQVLQEIQSFIFETKLFIFQHAGFGVDVNQKYTLESLMLYLQLIKATRIEKNAKHGKKK